MEHFFIQQLRLLLLTRQKYCYILAFFRYMYLNILFIGDSLPTLQNYIGKVDTYVGSRVYLEMQ